MPVLVVIGGADVDRAGKLGHAARKCGDVAWKDAKSSVDLTRRVIGAAGTGLAADELAAGETARSRGSTQQA